jgi:ribose transport system substrate-binding protein
MSLTIPRRRRSRAFAACAAISLTAIAATACSSSSSSSSTSQSSGTSPGAAGVQYAQAQLNKYSGLVTSFTAPGSALSGLKAKLSGKTIWYIPIFLQAPAFTADAQDLVEPLALAGAKVHVCDAGANPSQANACLKEAVAAKAAGIITDAMGYSFAAQAYSAAIAAHIPVVATSNDDVKGFPVSSDLATVSIGLTADARLAADWIIADSGGKANVLYTADNSAQGVLESAATRDEFARECPGCKVTVVEFGDLTVQNLATAVSSAMVKNPGINYVYGGYDAPSGIYALQGAKQVTGRHFTYVTGTGQPPGLQRVAAGQQAADPGIDTVDAMWNTADALFRIVTGAKQVQYTPAFRIFTKSNVPSNTKDASAYASGQWYTNGAFKPMYTKLWGL